MTDTASAPPAAEADAAAVRPEVETFCAEHCAPHATVAQRWTPLAGAGRATTMHVSAAWPRKVRTLWRGFTLSWRSGSARHCSLARSDPALGSQKSCHPPTRPSSISPTYRSPCSGVP